jgi:hypothetical protein
MILEPFNLEKAVQGHPVAYRGLGPTELIMTDFKAKGRPLLLSVLRGEIADVIIVHELNGRINHDGKDDPRDLFLIGEEKLWLLDVFIDTNGHQFMTGPYDEQKHLEDARSRLQTKGYTYFKTLSYKR